MFAQKLLDIEYQQRVSAVEYEIDSAYQKITVQFLFLSTKLQIQKCYINRSKNKSFRCFVEVNSECEYGIVVYTISLNSSISGLKNNNNMQVRKRRMSEEIGSTELKWNEKKGISKLKLSICPTKREANRFEGAGKGVRTESS